MLGRRQRRQYRKSNRRPPLGLIIRRTETPFLAATILERARRSPKSPQRSRHRATHGYQSVSSLPPDVSDAFVSYRRRRGKGKRGMWIALVIGVVKQIIGKQSQVR